MFWVIGGWGGRGPMNLDRRFCAAELEVEGDWWMLVTVGLSLEGEISGG